MVQSTAAMLTCTREASDALRLPGVSSQSSVESCQRYGERNSHTATLNAILDDSDRASRIRAEPSFPSPKSRWTCYVWYTSFLRLSKVLVAAFSRRINDGQCSIDVKILDPNWTGLSAHTADVGRWTMQGNESLPPLISGAFGNRYTDKRAPKMLVQSFLCQFCTLPDIDLKFYFPFCYGDVIKKGMNGDKELRRVKFQDGRRCGLTKQHGYDITPVPRIRVSQALQDSELRGSAQMETRLCKWADGMYLWRVQELRRAQAFGMGCIWWRTVNRDQGQRVRGRPAGFQRVIIVKKCRRQSEDMQSMRLRGQATAEVSGRASRTELEIVGTMSVHQRETSTINGYTRRMRRHLASCRAEVTDEDMLDKRESERRSHENSSAVTTIRDGHTTHQDPDISSSEPVQCFTHNVRDSNLRLQPALCGLKGDQDNYESMSYRWLSSAHLDSPILPRAEDVELILGAQSTIGRGRDRDWERIQEGMHVVLPRCLRGSVLYERWDEAVNLKAHGLYATYNRAEQTTTLDTACKENNGAHERDSSTVIKLRRDSVRFNGVDASARAAVSGLIHRGYRIRGSESRIIPAAPAHATERVSFTQMNTDHSVLTVICNSNTRGRYRLSNIKDADVAHSQRMQRRTRARCCDPLYSTTFAHEHTQQPFPLSSGRRLYYDILLERVVQQRSNWVPFDGWLFALCSARNFSSTYDLQDAPRQQSVSPAAFYSAEAALETSRHWRRVTPVSVDSMVRLRREASMIVRFRYRMHGHGLTTHFAVRAPRSNDATMRLWREEAREAISQSFVPRSSHSLAHLSPPLAE
ncbi:hypothetical protein BDW22DRAFT_1468946 [Trametopsis cervina]|nr:hypothetical protein BDW22DRAFT_1468946 [Trametopsis cervina]